MKIVSSEVMRKIDEQTIVSGHTSGYVLMDRAGRKSAQEIDRFLKVFHSNFKRKFVVVCGSGNNGGDGYVIADELYGMGYSVRVLAQSSVDQLKGEALAHAKEMSKEIPVSSLAEGIILESGEVIVDCLLGTGLTRNVEGLYLKAITAINKSNNLVVSIDIASGLDGTSGNVLGNAVIADLTLAIGLPKIGFFVNQGPEHTGRLKCIDIGFPVELIRQAQSEGQLVEETYLEGLFTRRQPSSHKYNCGNALIIGGSKSYKGAVALAAKAAARSGAGMVTCVYPGLPPEIGMNSIISVSATADSSGCFSDESIDEVKELLQKPVAVAVGPGMLGSDSEKQVFKAALSSNANVIIDAGALAFVYEFKELIANKTEAVVLTPHYGEFMRLVDRFSLRGTVEEMAKELSRTINAVLILKGQFTRIYFPDKSVLINSSGCVTLATAGSGDVLSGVLAAFLSEFTDANKAVAAAVYVHGKTGELSLKGIRSTVADDLIDQLPEVLKSLSVFG